MTVIEAVESLRRLGIRITWQPEGFEFRPLRVLCEAERAEVERLCVELHSEPANRQAVQQVEGDIFIVRGEPRDEAVRAWLRGIPPLN